MAVSGELMSGWLAGRGFDSAGQGADLDEVAGEDAVPAEVRPPVIPVSSVRFQPQLRLRWLSRPSDPIRHQLNCSGKLFSAKVLLGKRISGS